MPPLQDISNGQTPTRQFLKERTIKDQPGPKPKLIADRVYKHRAPIIRPTKSYSHQRKVDILMFCHYHRVCDIDLETGLSKYRPPTLIEASRYWSVPPNTICTWRKRSDLIAREHTKSRMTHTI